VSNRGLHIANPQEYEAKGLFEGHPPVTAPSALPALGRERRHDDTTTAGPWPTAIATKCTKLTKHHKEDLLSLLLPAGGAALRAVSGGREADVTTSGWEPLIFHPSVWAL
jgi:hypothetical protein